MEDNEQEEGMSTGKKVVAGAAIGVAVPAAVTVAKKLLGNGDGGEEQQQQAGGRSRKSSAGSTGSSRTRATQGKSRSGSARSGASASKRSIGSQTQDPVFRREQRFPRERPHDGAALQPGEAAQDRGPLEHDEGSARAGDQPQAFVGEAARARRGPPRLHRAPATIRRAEQPFPGSSIGRASGC
jgi:hypothetical protein